MLRSLQLSPLVLAASLLCPLSLAAQAQAAGSRSAPPRPLPLEATRSFALDTREGTWLSVDVVLTADRSYSKAICT